MGGSVSLEERCRACRVTSLQCDIERESVPCVDQSIGFIVFTEVIEHPRVGPLHVLRELRRIQKPGGKLLFSTPNLLTLKSRASFVFGSTTYDMLEMPYDALAAEERIGHCGHLRVSSMAEVLDFFRRSGFRAVTSTYRDILDIEAVPLGWTPHGLRVRASRLVTQTITPLRNTLFVILVRDQ